MSWTHVRVPPEQRDRLKRFAERMLRSHERGLAPLPGDYAEKVPLHYVIARLLDEAEAKRARSRARRRPKRRS